MPSKVPALIDWLVAAFTAIGASSDPPFVVYDGPVISDAADKLILWVGLEEPNSASPEVAATFNQARADMGGATRTEQPEIRCAVEAWGGTGDLATVRVQAFAILAAVENYVRSDNTMFGGNAQLANPGVTGGSLIQDNTQEGAVARVTFAIIFSSFT